MFADATRSRTLFVPGHIGLSAKGIEYPSASPLAKAALGTFGKQVAQVSPVAFALQGYTYNRIIFNAVISRVGQVVSGEATLDEAYKRIEQDALLDAFTDSDFRLGGTNSKGYILSGSYGLAKNTAASLRYFSGDAISGAPFSVDVLQVDLNVRF